MNTMAKPIDRRKAHIRLRVNGEEVEVSFAPYKTLLEVLREDYIRTARAKGLSPSRVVFVHGLRNALIPIVTILGLSLPDLFGGAFIIETIFAWPGMGRLGVMAIFQRNYPLIMGITVFSAVLIVLGNLLADMAYAWVDPRIRYGKK